MYMNITFCVSFCKKALFHIFEEVYTNLSPQTKHEIYTKVCNFVLQFIYQNHVNFELILSFLKDVITFYVSLPYFSISGCYKPNYIL